MPIIWGQVVGLLVIHCLHKIHQWIWSWPSGYFFFIIDGKVDDDRDGVPNKII